MSISLKDLVVKASGIPGLDFGVSILTTTYTTIENIKVYKQQCRDLSGRCVNLMNAFCDSSVGLEGTKAIERADEITAVIRRVDRKVNEWANLNRLKSFLQQREIKDGIDSLHRDIDGAMMQFQIHMHMELARNQIGSRATQERDKEEIRDLLQKIVKSTEDMKTLVNMSSSESRPLEEIMEGLQTELMDPNLQPNQEQDFKESLWLLHQKTSKMPPLTDLTGQVIRTSSYVVARGTFNDVYAGKWLDMEQVALRLPRTFTDNPDVQKRFQREVSIWRKLNHPNVVPLYGIAYIEKDLYSVSPWMDNDTAIKYVLKCTPAQRLKILGEVAAGLEYLHNNDIVHGDLRGANVLISKAGIARLSDFGLSKLLEECGQGMTSSPGINPRWIAPELLLKNAALSTHCDVWSFGMVCLELVTGEQPFSKITRDIAVQRELDHGKIPDRPGREATAQGLSDDMWNLMKKCWHKKPESRPSVAEVRRKLFEIQEISTYSGDRLTTSRPHRSMFSIRRPSTSESKRSTESSGSISPLSVTGPQGPLQTFERTQRHPSNGDLAIIIESRWDREYANTENNRYNSGPPRLDLSHLGSSSPPSINRHQRTPSGGSPSGVRSFVSYDSGVHMSASLREAVTDPKPIVNLTHSGSVASGTLEGLVERLINNFNVNRDIEYRDVMLTACVDFTTPEDLFAILARRFHEAEVNVSIHAEGRVAIQYNIFMVLMHWLKSRRLQVDQQLLWQMRNFCESAIRMKTSATMVDKARDLFQLIKDRPAQDLLNSPLALSPGRRVPSASQMHPHGLAIGLTLLEGDKYKNILPSDYIAHLRRLTIPNNVEAAYLTNNKIVLWVKQSVLHYEEVENRTQVLSFFINTALECLRLRNFASLTAIAIALHSTPIERLKLTRDGLSPYLRRKLDELNDLVDPSSNHRAYRRALERPVDPDYANTCIPWLPVHLHELHSVLHQNPTVITVDGRPLINFQRYIRFTDRVREILHHQPPSLEQFRQDGQLAYIEHQLRSVQLSTQADDELIRKSDEFHAREGHDYKGRKRELASLGFRVRT
ncbi:ras guanine nucleotide exchange factor domain-containing protein [Crucibulum laeve]|uniref:Ras guanine nucleotide exchange factor domain-containing protein n=1 Tax=Crucibulum laeve TaxID=68775 RepID=A0A5C3MBU3_9AGAR|nr:ras guanine nucleotide exchange factor domain-containing protein [Crucibulum laeve]